jgi:hypothetical protein
MSKRIIVSTLMSLLWLVGSSAEATNSLNIEQDGISNRAAILQATIEPFSDHNDATISQKGSGNTALIRQDSDANVAAIAQVSPASGIGFDDGNQAEIQQSSNGNHFAEIAQEAEFYANNRARIGQNGDPQEAYIVQVGGGNRANIDQSIGGNYFSLVQVGHVNRMEGIQVGAGNQARVTQGEKGDISRRNSTPDVPCEYCEILLTQIGDDNEATIVQKGLDGSPGVDLGGRRIIKKNENSATINQHGMLNEAWIEQTGNNNIASIDQYGDNNTGSITQEGDGNEFHLKQYNDNNSYSVTQSGGASASMVQYGAP